MHVTFYFSIFLNYILIALFSYHLGSGFLRCKVMSRARYNNCLFDPKTVEFCGPRTMEDTEICCQKVARAKLLKCMEEETKKRELIEAKKTAQVYDISNPYVKVTRRPILRLRRPRIG